MTHISEIKADHLIGREVGSSTILREISRGGMAIVFAAYQRTLRRQIAVKVLPRELMTPASADLFYREAEAAAILYHPGIIPVYEVGDTGDFLFFSMPLVSGDTLAGVLQKAQRNILPSRRILPVEKTLSIMKQVLDALEYAHSNEIVHRDIKPGNILIEAQSGRPVILDFGIATVLRSEKKGKPMIQGTPVYMAPEQILSHDVDGRADVYAAGTMLFKMLAGTLPFPDYKNGLELMKLKVKRKRGIFTQLPSQVNPLLRPEMDRIILSAVNPDPSLRFESCRVFMESLEQYRRKFIRSQYE